MRIDESRRGRLVGALVGVVALAGCTFNADVAPTAEDPNSDNTKPTFTQFSDLPVPGKATMQVDKTLVFGGQQDWYGRLVLSTQHNPSVMFDFYKQQMPTFGWREITSVRSVRSVLTYDRQGRVATIQIEGTAIRGSEVSVTVSPREANSPGGPSTPGQMPVTIQPLR